LGFLIFGGRLKFSFAYVLFWSAILKLNNKRGKMYNSVVIINDKGQEIKCNNFSELVEKLVKINDKLLPSGYHLQVREDDWEFYDFF
tara:strand:+ start:160 stop:420 length:261 start_codon:yes stop_codon:yes gene_type:complete